MRVIDGFTFFKSYYDAVEHLDAETKAEYFDVLFRYALREEEPETPSAVVFALFSLIKPNLDSSKAKRKAGQAGGKQSSSKKQAENKQTQADCKQPSTDKEEEEEEDKEKEEDKGKGGGIEEEPPHNSKNFLDMKDWVILNKRTATGKHREFMYEGRAVSISDKNIPYWKATQDNLSKQEADTFYKTMLNDKEAVANAMKL